MNVVTSNPFPPPLESYGDGAFTSLGTVLLHRMQAEPFNVVATAIFLLAIVHTFLAPMILKLANRLQHRHEARLSERREAGELADGKRQSVPAALLHFCGEVEAVFGLWVVPLGLVLAVWHGPAVARDYIGHRVSYVEPLFVVVIMAIAGSRPVVQCAMQLLGRLAGRSPARWWLTLLTLGPLLGSLITEPAAMTICALLLGREFYRLKPGRPFMYATLGLLFVNVSVGGALTNFAAPPVLMVATKWGWSTLHMLEQFGSRAVAGIILGNLLYFLVFRFEFKRLAKVRAELNRTDDEEEPVPFWITLVHFLFLGWTVLVSHEPAFFIGGFLFFLGFTLSTRAYQDRLAMRSPLLVGFFLAGLVVHGGLQGWWIEPVLGRMSAYPLLLGATVLTAFNDNAAITYLATLVPNFDAALKHAVVAGAICGGGLTVIANAPNPAGQSILQKYFPGGISAGGLLLGALPPTVVMLIVFVVGR